MQKDKDRKSSSREWNRGTHGGDRSSSSASRKSSRSSHSKNR